MKDIRFSLTNEIAAFTWYTVCWFRKQNVSVTLKWLKNLTVTNIFLVREAFTTLLHVTRRPPKPFNVNERLNQQEWHVFFMSSDWSPGIPLYNCKEGQMCIWRKSYISFESDLFFSRQSCVISFYFIYLFLTFFLLLAPFSIIYSIYIYQEFHLTVLFVIVL